MRKFLPYILIFIFIANIFAPFSVVFQKNKSVPSFQKNVAQADIYDNLGFGVKVEVTTPTKTSFKIEITRNNDGYSDFNFKLKENDSIINEKNLKYEGLSHYITFEGLKENSTYTLDLTASRLFELGSVKQENKTTLEIKTADTNTKQKSTIKTSDQEFKKTEAGTLPACSFTGGFFGSSDGTFTGCIAQGIYYALYTPTSWLFAGAGQFFDWMFDYSVDDTSYKNSFVTEGWKIVRDISNVFFIFILLYIAFALILGLQNVKAKDMMVNVIIIGLLINFSMFFAQVIIDSSNILARVFYNSEAIKESASVGAQSGGVPLGDGLGTEISLSAGIVSKVDPQKIVRNAGNVTVVDPISGNSAEAGSSSVENLGAGGFILVTLLAIAVNIVGIFVFISVALIFVARVIGLWFAMIFAPFAFLSYTIPALSKLKMVGWKDWWSDLVSLSFVAPLFMFMLYLILLFVEKGFGSIVQEENTGVKFILSVIIPFVFVMVMLLTAKKLAKEYSGSVGQAVSKGINTVAGVAGGVALGGAAIAARGTLGRAGSAVASSDRLKRAEARGGISGFGAKMLLKGGKAAGAGSMDLRGIKVAGKSLADKDIAGSSIGKPQVGGFTGRRTQKVEDRQKRMRELEVGEDSSLTQDVRKAEAELEKERNEPGRQDAIRDETSKLSGLEKSLAASERAVSEAERAVKDASDKYGANSTQANAARTTRNINISVANTQRLALENKKADIAFLKKPIEDAEVELEKAKNTIIAENKSRRENYAKTIQGGWSNSINVIVSGGQHAVRGEREAANRILSGIQQERHTS